MLALLISLFVLAFADDQQTQPANQPIVGSNQEIPQEFKTFVDSSSNFCRQLANMKFNETQQYSQEEVQQQTPMIQLKFWIGSVCAFLFHF